MEDADSERATGVTVTLEGRPMTSGSRLQETGRPANYPKKELYVCWGRAASNAAWNVVSAQPQEASQHVKASRHLAGIYQEDSWII